jgi:hypothetical protein
VGPCLCTSLCTVGAFMRLSSAAAIIIKTAKDGSNEGDSRQSESTETRSQKQWLWKPTASAKNGLAARSQKRGPPPLRIVGPKNTTLLNKPSRNLLGFVSSYRE